LDNAIMTARMMGLVTDSGVTVSTGIVTRDYTAWTQGLLVFDRAPLRDVATELGHAYGVTIRIADSVLAGETIIAEVDIGKKSLPQILDAMCLSMSAHYTSIGDTLVLARGLRDSRVPRVQKERQPDPQPEQQYGR
jgi:ferric-dicitrate binding protein FerR (iron transport regulator)